MSGNNVLGVAKNPANQQDGVARFSGSKSEKEISSISFMDMLNSSGQTPPRANVSADAGRDAGVSGAQSKSNNYKNSYDPYASPNSKIEVKEKLTAEKLQTESKDTLDEFGEEVNQVLKEELGVTDEQIQAALQELGLTAVDLVDAKNLTMLVQKLTGMQDIATLLMSGSFQNIMEQLDGLTANLCSELGVTMEELTALCKEMAESRNTAAPEGEETVSMGKQETVAHEAVKDAKEQVVNNTSQVQTEEAAQTVVKQPEDSTKESGQNVQQEQKSAEMPEETQQMEDGSENADQNGRNNSPKDDSAKDSFPDKSAQHVANTSSVTNLHAQAVQPFAMETVQAVPTAFTGQLDIADIIEQVTRNAKVTFTAELTSMEMQLNPENLGKIYLHITQKEGTVRAEIAAQSETVKNALEAQVAELRQSLNQQGVKVDAIEVTVATHEFEQNLDSNARQEEQLHQQMEESGKKNRRSLNLNDLDQLSGLMTEEETLVTKMMQENGNQVDLNA